MIDLCQCFRKGMKKIYTYQMFLCFFEKASVIRALIILLCFNNLIIYYCVIASIYFYLNGYALQVGRWPPRPVLQHPALLNT